METLKRIESVIAVIGGIGTLLVIAAIIATMFVWMIKGALVK